jgi:hypothetical protein
MFESVQICATRRTFVHFPVALGENAHGKLAVFGIVALAATGTRKIATPGRSPMIIVMVHAVMVHVYELPSELLQKSGRNCRGSGTCAGGFRHSAGLDSRPHRGRRFTIFRCVFMTHLHDSSSRLIGSGEYAFLGAAIGLQDFLAKTQRLGRNFHELVVGDEFDGLL